MDNVVGLCCEHALDVVANITEDNSISLASCARAGWLGRERLDLKTLQHRDGEESSCGVRVGEARSRDSRLAFIVNKDTSHGDEPTLERPA